MSTENEFDEFQDADDEFEDASDVPLPLPDDMNLQKALDEAQIAIDYFFNNQFDEARNLMEPWAKTSMYHSVGSSVFLFLEAMLTFEHKRIAEASDGLKRSISVCNRYRKKNSFGESLGKMVRKINYESYSELEAHAELCFAECLLLKATLTFVEDETLSSFIKAGFKIRQCYNCYKECQNILLHRNWGASTTKIHFEGGVRMGMGTFNLMISMLPSKIIKLLEFIGFSGNREVGLHDLKDGFRADGIRRILCVMTLLAYNLIVVYILSHQEGDLEICDEILSELLKKHPDGMWFLFFKGRMEFIKGNLDGSMEWYQKSWQSQSKWPQFHHVCFWEMTWVNCIKTNWKEALVYATHLLEGSRWSRTIYSYQKAMLLYTMRESLNDTERLVINNLMEDVPKYKQRVAGKSLPMEKFVIKKAERYFNQNNRLVLPIIELMYLWNLFKVLRKDFKLGENIFKMIEKEEAELEKSRTCRFAMDNRGLVLLLKGACFRQMGSPLQALQCLESVIAMQKDYEEDNYLVPYAIVELALTEWEQHNRTKALLALEDAKKNYSGYSLESRLHFRIHSAQSEFKAKLEDPYVTKL